MAEGDGVLWVVVITGVSGTDDDGEVMTCVQDIAIFESEFEARNDALERSSIFGHIEDQMLGGELWMFDELPHTKTFVIQRLSVGFSIGDVVRSLARFAWGGAGVGDFDDELDGLRDLLTEHIDECSVSVCQVKPKR